MNKAKVECSLGRTLSLADFESVKIHVSLSLECDASKEAIDLAYARAKRFVEAKVAEQEHEWKVGKDGREDDRERKAQQAADNYTRAY